MLCMLHCWRELFDLRIRQVKGTGLEIPVEASRDYSFYRKVIFFHPPQKEQNTQVSRTCATKKRNVTLCRLSGDWTFLLDPFFFFLFVPALLEKLVCLPFAVDARQRAGKDNFGWHLSHEVWTRRAFVAVPWKKPCKRFRKAAIGISTFHFCPFCRLPIGPRQAEKSMESPTFGRAFWLLLAAWPLADRSNLSFHGLRIGWQLGFVVQAPFFSWWS